MARTLTQPFGVPRPPTSRVIPPRFSRLRENSFVGKSSLWRKADGDNTDARRTGSAMVGCATLVSALFARLRFPATFCFFRARRLFCARRPARSLCMRVFWSLSAVVRFVVLSRFTKATNGGNRAIGHGPARRSPPWPTV